MKFVGARSFGLFSIATYYCINLELRDSSYCYIPKLIPTKLY